MATETGLGVLQDMEPLGNVLDLGRPELAPLMNRYSSEQVPRHQTSIFSPPIALIVEDRGVEQSSLRTEIESNGWLVKTCQGPGRSRCPLLRGQRCELRKSADAAVVFIDPRQMTHMSGMLPRLRCASDHASPAILVLEGQVDGFHKSGTSATIGSIRGPRAIFKALKRLLIG